MTSLELVEYWSGVSSGQYLPSGNTFTFDPRPASLTKDVKVKWRVRRPGYRRKIERGRFRYNEEIQLKVSGSCNQAKRDELEWYVKRDSLFLLQNCDMKTIHAEQTSDSEDETTGIDFPAFQYYQDALNYDYGLGSGKGTKVYVIILNAKFIQREGKEDWFDYQITLKRVHPKRH